MRASPTRAKPSRPTPVRSRPELAAEIAGNRRPTASTSFFASALFAAGLLPMHFGATQSCDYASVGLRCQTGAAVRRARSATRRSNDSLSAWRLASATWRPAARFEPAGGHAHTPVVRDGHARHGQQGPAIHKGSKPASMPPAWPRSPPLETPAKTRTTTLCGMGLTLASPPCHQSPAQDVHCIHGYGPPPPADLWSANYGAVAAATAKATWFTTQRAQRFGQVRV